MFNWKSVLDDAWEHIDLGEHIAAAALVRRVLAVQPDAIDAYVVLAETRELRTEAIALLTEAVRIGDRTGKVLADEAFDPDGLYDRYAHARALNNLARLLWADGRPHQRSEGAAQCTPRTPPGLR